MGVKMRLVLLFILLVCSVSAYQPKELLFSTKKFFENEKRASGSESRVVTVKGARQFSSYVLKSSLPVVVKVLAPQKQMVDFEQENYQKVADSYKGSVSFVSMNFIDNEDVIKFLMMKIRISKIAFPFYLFFKNGAMLLPLVSGVIEKDRLESMVKERFNFIDMKKSLKKNVNGFSSKEEKKKDKFAELERRDWNFGENWSDKLKKMILGFRALSHEAKSYRLHERWVRNKEYTG